MQASWLRWDRVALALMLALPFVAAMLLGFLWLYERGWLLWYLLGVIALAGAVRLGRAVALRAQRKAPLPPLALSAGQPPSADWSAAERAAYDRARQRIRDGLPAPLGWEALPARALEVVEAVAEDLSGGRRGALSFTAPEALLLVGRLAERYRGLMRQYVPFVDRLPLQALWWAWQRQGMARTAAEGGWMVWRGVRLFVNPAAALMRETERVLTSGLQDRLGAAVTRDLQARLLDEAAMAAIDLYSGRLRFTAAELAQVALPEAGRDAPGPPEPPLRVLLVGQVSAGKSTLLNLLAGVDAAETDAAPVTDRTAAHEIRLHGVPVRLVDTPGLDGSARRRDAVAAEAAEADLVLWILRADRPDRAPDRAFQAALAARLAREPERRAPPVVPVAAAVDLLMPGWPFPEHRLPQAAQHRLGAALAALAEDGATGAVPVSAEPVVWNLDHLEEAIAAALPEARQVQRQRRRLAAARGAGLGAVPGRLAGAVGEAAVSLGGTLRTAAGGLARRWRRDRG